MNGIRFKSRLTYSVFSIELPSVSLVKRHAIAKQIVAGIYPGSIDQKRIILRKNGGKGKYLAFLMDPKSGKSPELSSTLFFKRMKIQNAVVIYCDQNYFEVLNIDKQCVTKTNVYHPDQIDSIIANLDTGRSVLLYTNSEGNNTADVVSRQLHVEKNTIRDSFLISIQQPLYSFSVSGCWSFKFIVLFFLFGFLFSLLMITAISYQEAEQRRVTAENSERTRLLLEQEEKRQEILMERYLSLVKKYENMIKSLPYEPYLVLSILHNAMSSEPKIRTLSINGNEISISLYTRNPVALMKRFENNKYIYNIDFHSNLEEDGRNLMVMSFLLRYPEYSSDKSIDGKVVELDALLREMEERKKAVPATLNEYQDYLYSLARKSSTSIKQMGTSVSNGEFYISFVSQGRPESVYEFVNQLGRGEKALIYNNLHIQYENDSKKITLQSIFPTGIVKSGNAEVIGLQATDESGSQRPVDMALNYITPNVKAQSVAKPVEITVNTEEAKRVNWLVYMGYIIDEKNDMIFVQNTRNNTVLNLSRSDEKQDGYIKRAENEAEILLNGERYIVQRSQ